jgi:hypothetical protein
MPAPVTETVRPGPGPVGIVGYHAYLPAYRLNRAVSAAAISARLSR